MRLRTCALVALTWLSFAATACDVPPPEGDDASGSTEGAEGTAQALFEPPPGLGQHSGSSSLRGGEGLRGTSPWTDPASTFISSYHPHLGSFKLQMHETNCELILTQTTFEPSGRQTGTRTLWTSRGSVWNWVLTSKARRCYALFQTDGNFVIYGTLNDSPPWPQRPTFQPIWDTGTWNQPGAVLQLEPTGNVVIYNRSGTAVWQTKTAQPLPSVVTQDGTPVNRGRPGCRFAETERQCVGPLMSCRDVFVCSNDQPNPRTEKSGWYACGACTVGGKF